MRGIHGIGQPIECSCGQKFRSAMDLSRHRKKTSHKSKNRPNHFSLPDDFASKEIVSDILEIEDKITATTNEDIIEYTERPSLESEDININDTFEKGRGDGEFMEKDKVKKGEMIESDLPVMEDQGSASD